VVVRRSLQHETATRQNARVKKRLSRSEEARRIIQEYADQLREIIRKLRRRLH
jgi:hypothetical protein